MRVSLTGTGRGTLGGATTLYVVGVVLGYPELVALGAGGLVALVLALGLVARRPQVAIERRLEPTRVVVGGTTQALITVWNRGRNPSPRFTAVDQVGDRRQPVTVPRIAPGAVSRLPYLVRGEQRGRIVLGPVVVTRVDPLGLLHRRQPHAADHTLWVHPRTYPAVPVPTGIDLELEGAQIEGAPRGAITFSSVREYVPGDDVRLIHWRSTARTGTLMVRDHVDTSQPRTTVALDVRAGRWTAASFEDGVEVAASVALGSERSGHPARLVTLDPLQPDARGEGPSSLLDRLALVEPWAEGGGRLLDWLESVPAGGALVFVTGAPDQPTLTRVTGLRRRFSMVALVGVTPATRPRVERRTGSLVVTAGSAIAAINLWNGAVGR